MDETKKITIVLHSTFLQLYFSIKNKNKTTKTLFCLFAIRSSSGVFIFC